MQVVRRPFMRAVQRHYGYGLAARAPALRAALVNITGTVLSPFLRGSSNR